jgi:glyoxylase-like metal-dependent hydrolase (beta-lactamase superfamily II)
VVQAVTAHVRRIGLGFVNVFLIVLPEGLTLVDAGIESSPPRILKAVRQLGRRPEEISDIVVTHCHADHTGGLAAMKEATGARVWMDAAEAALVRTGRSSRPVEATPGSLVGRVGLRLMARRPSLVKPVEVEGEISQRTELPVAGGLLAIPAPGHTEGHLVYLWPEDGGVLFLGDAAGRSPFRLRPSPIYEDHDQGLRTLHALAGLEYQVACFAHGRPIKRNAALEFRRAWPPLTRPAA